MHTILKWACKGSKHFLTLVKIPSAICRHGCVDSARPGLAQRRLSRVWVPEQPLQGKQSQHRHGAPAVQVDGAQARCAELDAEARALREAKHGLEAQARPAPAIS